MNGLDEETSMREIQQWRGVRGMSRFVLRGMM